MSYGVWHWNAKLFVWVSRTLGVLILIIAAFLLYDFYTYLDSVYRFPTLVLFMFLCEAWRQVPYHTGDNEGGFAELSDSGVTLTYPARRYSVTVRWNEIEGCRRASFIFSRCVLDLSENRYLPIYNLERSGEFVRAVKENLLPNPQRRPL